MTQKSASDNTLINYGMDHYATHVNVKVFRKRKCITAHANFKVFRKINPGNSA